MFLTWLVVCIVLGSICLAQYLREAQRIEQSIREGEVGRVELFAQLYGQEFRSVAADLRMLVDNEALQDFIASDGPGPLARLTREVALASRHNEEYDQIRFLDESGRERVRINSGGVVVPGAQLQRKGDRPYFREALSLPAGQVYLSAFDLNVENGLVERPFKPTLRFASPVFDAGGRRRGVVVINYLGVRILNSFQRLAPLYQARLRVVNDKGFWLRGANSEDEWGFMLPERAGRTLAVTAPGVWAEITARSYGQSRGLGGLLTWRRVTPAKAVNLTGAPVRAAEESLVIASDLNAVSWDEAFSALRRRYAVVSIALFVLTTSGVWLFGSRKQVRERLEAAHRHNAALIRAANVAVIATTADGIITDVNPGAERLFGWSASELIGKQTPGVFSDAAEMEARAKQLSLEFGRTIAPSFEVFVLRVLRDGSDEREWTGIRKDGQRLPLWLSLSVLRDSHERVTGYLGVVSDLTIHKQAEQALHEAKAAAEESVRMKSRFLANMSHEIRTPMNGVVGMTGLLLDSKLTDDQRMLANTVRTSADALLSIINDILDFSKIEAGQLTFDPQPFDLIEPVEGCLAIMAERAHGNGLEIAYLVAENVPGRVIGDAGRIRQVLLNLVGNAVKFTKQGEVIVSVTKVSEQNHQVRLRFAVRDTGPGLTAEQQARLFQPFVQADSSTTRKFGGTGLGLAISKQLVGLMHGEIGIESELDKGSTFWFTLELPVVPALPKVIQYRTGLVGRRALVLDDNDTNREILRRQLVSWRVDSTTVNTGEEALAALRAGKEANSPFDFAVFDMQMPGMTGLEVAHAVQSDPSIAKVKIIILTSMGRMPPRQELDEAGVGACLAKPVRQSQFHDLLVTLMSDSPAGATTMAPLEQPPLPFTHTADLNLRILVAEDNPVNQHLIQRLLQKCGYQPDIVVDGAKAVEAARSRPYDVILMDCEMPELDGFGATGCIREWEAERRALGETVARLHIVAMTANAMAGDREACLAAGMDDYMSKPLHLNDLAAALARAPVR
ncbi:MAG TPA: response regulator [Bryobacteraceae bacterium]|nr:response regulator [Bryobacteraceae bacterium]